MGMTVRENDSPRAVKLIESGKEITRLIREAVTADRHSRHLSKNARSNRWTDAARKRDEMFKYLRNKLQELSNEI